MTTKIFLARHGSHDELGRILSGRSGIALNSAGHAEAQRLSTRLSGERLRAIHSSPRRRAVETAEWLAPPHGLAVEIHDALDEIDFGAWSGASFAALARDPRWTLWNSARGSARAADGETMADAVARTVRHLETLVGDTVCVSHCDVIRGVVAHYLGLDGDRLLAFECDPGSLTTLLVEEGVTRVATLNERPQ